MQVLILTLAALLAADDAKQDQQKLQGTWKPTKMECRGNARPAERMEKMRLVIKGDVLQPQEDGQTKENDVAKFTLDAAKTKGDKAACKLPRYGS